MFAPAPSVEQVVLLSAPSVESPSVQAWQRSPSEKAMVPEVAKTQKGESLARLKIQEQMEVQLAQVTVGWQEGAGPLGHQQFDSCHGLRRIAQEGYHHHQKDDDECGHQTSQPILMH